MKQIFFLFLLVSASYAQAEYYQQGLCSQSACTAHGTATKDRDCQYYQYLEVFKGDGIESLGWLTTFYAGNDEIGWKVLDNSVVEENDFSISITKDGLFELEIPYGQDNRVDANIYFNQDRSSWLEIEYACNLQSP